MKINHREKRKMSREEIEGFLWFGYVINYSSTLPFENYKSNLQFKDLPLEELVEIGAERWHAALKESLDQNIDNRTIVVPISGGLDSRAILAGLLEYFDPKDIYTYTFGTPGTLDFELGNRIAASCKTRHFIYDLAKYSYTLDTLMDISQRVDNRTRIFGHMPIQLIERDMPGNKVFFSGFMGGQLAGHSLPLPPSQNWKDAIKYFVKKNRNCQSLNLTPPNFNPEAILPKDPLFDQRYLSYDDQLDFAIRQQCFIKPVVLLKGYKYRTPFTQSSWVNFILNVPIQYRLNLILYKKILKRVYPKLFSLPTKTTMGIPLDAGNWQFRVQRTKLKVRAGLRNLFPFGHWGSHYMTNYIDFDQSLRYRRYFKNMVYENIQDLKRRAIVDWINVDDIWTQHQNRRANHGTALTLLASLEINLKAQEG